MEVRPQTDRHTWDEHVRRQSGHPLQAWAWGELKERFGWQAHRLCSADEAASAQLLIRPFRGLAAAYVPRGPVLSGRRDVDPALVEAIVALARSRRAAFVRLEPDVLTNSPQQTTVDALLREYRFASVERTLQPRSSIRLNLQPEPEALLAGFSKGHRADVRRAEREGVTTRIGDSEADVDRLHEVMRATQARKTFGIHSAAYYRAAWRLFGDDACLLLAEHESGVVAAALVISFGEQAIYLAAGATEQGLAHRASHALQWRAIRWARDKGARSYDLWGIPDARGRQAQLEASQTQAETHYVPSLEAEARRDPLNGVFRFKKGWGGDIVRTMPAYDRVFIRPAYWFWRWRRSEA